jgi:hypothetical protein
MAMNHLGKVGWWALWLSPMVIVPLALFASKPWLKQQNDGVELGIGAAASIFVMGYAVFLAARVNGRLDEVEIAGQRFAQTKGMTIGSFAAVLVMILPLSMNALVDLQTLAMAAVSIWWARRIYRHE